MFDDGVELLESFHGLGDVLDVVVEGFDSEVDGFFGGELVAFGGEVGLVDAGPGVGEAGEVVGVGLIGLGGFADGVDEEGADEVLGAGSGGGRRLGGADGGGEVVGGLDYAKIAFTVALGLFLAPLLEVGVIPARDGDAEVADEFFFIGSGTYPAEGIGVAGFEVERGDVAVGFLGEEPGADLFVLPAVVEPEVEFFAEELGKEGEPGSGFPLGNFSQ